MSPYTSEEMAHLEADYHLYKLYEAADLGSFLAAHAPGVPALAMRGDVGVTADVVGALPNLEIVSPYGVRTDAIDLPYAKCGAFTSLPTY